MSDFTVNLVDGTQIGVNVTQDHVITSNVVTGAPGDSVELRITATHVQWRQVGSETWTDLIALTELTGETGDAGAVQSAIPPGDTNQLWIDTTDETPNDLITLDPGVQVGDLVVVRSVDPPVVEGIGISGRLAKITSSPVSVVAWDDFEDAPDGTTLHGRTTPSGHTWNVIGPPITINNGRASNGTTERSFAVIVDMDPNWIGSRVVEVFANSYALYRTNAPIIARHETNGDTVYGQFEATGGVSILYQDAEGATLNLSDGRIPGVVGSGPSHETGSGPYQARMSLLGYGNGNLIAMAERVGQPGFRSYAGWPAGWTGRLSGYTQAGMVIQQGYVSSVVIKVGGWF